MTAVKISLYEEKNQNGTFNTFVAVLNIDQDTNTIDSFFIQALDIDSSHIGKFFYLPTLIMIIN